MNQFFFFFLICDIDNDLYKYKFYNQEFTYLYGITICTKTTRFKVYLNSIKWVLGLNKRDNGKTLIVSQPLLNLIVYWVQLKFEPFMEIL